MCLLVLFLVAIVMADIVQLFGTYMTLSDHWVISYDWILAMCAIGLGLCIAMRFLTLTGLALWLFVTFLFGTITTAAFSIFEHFMIPSIVSNSQDATLSGYEYRLDLAAIILVVGLYVVRYLRSI